MPPLRERPTDILLLSDHFVEKYAQAHKKDVRRLSTSAIDALMSYHWPGNVRELENCIERATLLTNEHVIHSYHLPPTLRTAEQTTTTVSASLTDALASVERDLIADALKSKSRQYGPGRADVEDHGAGDPVQGFQVRNQSQAIPVEHTA